jgi:hypothetical protein
MRLRFGGKRFSERHFGKRRCEQLGRYPGAYTNQAHDCQAERYPPDQGVVVQAGDSIGAGLGADNWAAIDHFGLPREISVHNVSVKGQWMLTSLGQRETALFPFYDKRHTSVLVIQQGTNDLLGGNNAPYLYFNILKPFVSLSSGRLLCCR